MNKKGRPSAQRASRLLQTVGAHVLGVVINKTSVATDTYSYGDYQRA
jgi:hypothetical protein